MLVQQKLLQAALSSCCSHQSQHSDGPTLRLSARMLGCGLFLMECRYRLVYSLEVDCTACHQFDNKVWGCLAGIVAIPQIRWCNQPAQIQCFCRTERPVNRIRSGN
jgi:hypothetical protein